MPPHDTAGGGRRKRPFPAAFCSHKPLFFQKGTCYTQIKWMRLPRREAAAEKNEVFCMIIQNALVYTPRHTFERGTIIIRDGRIVPFAAPEEGEEVLDAEGLYALPGLVDIHFHGAMGKDFCDGTEEAIQTLADFEASKGVLAICPATMTYPEEILNKVMDAAAAHKNGKGADLVGINMEGPFISPKKVGAQNPEYVQGADAAMFRRLQKRAGGLIKLVDVAPEEPGNLDFIKECHNEVRISIAHTCTDYDTAVKAFEAGATHMTHLYNAMPGIHHRKPGPIGAGSERENVVAELICDGQHIHPSAVRMAFKLFPGRICLISDALRCCGMPDGQYTLGGQDVFLQNCVARLADGTIAGSATNLYDCMRKAVEFGIPKEQAILSATSVPAKELGQEAEIGEISSGKLADFVVCDEELNRKHVYLSGTQLDS